MVKRTGKKTISNQRNFCQMRPNSHFKSACYTNYPNEKRVILILSYCKPSLFLHCAKKMIK